MMSKDVRKMVKKERGAVRDAKDSQSNLNQLQHFSEENLYVSNVKQLTKTNRYRRHFDGNCVLIPSSYRSRGRSTRSL